MTEAKKLKIDSIAPEEEIIKVLHRSWFNIASQYFLVVFLVCFMMASFLAYTFSFPNLRNDFFEQIFFFGANLAFLALWIYCFLIWVDYYFDIWIITSDKIINIEQKSLFVRRVSEVKYEKIQDVTVEISGMLQTVINFGDVLVQTAGETENIQFRKVSNPHEIKNIIVKLQKDKENRKTHDFEEAIKEGLSSN